MYEKIVFLGGGNMAEGIIRAMIQNGDFDPARIGVQEIVPARCEYLKSTYGITAVTDGETLLQEADVVIIAVLPTVVKKVAGTVQTNVGKEKLILSIAAGIRICDLEEMIGSDRKIIRIMPNVLNQAATGYSAISKNINVTEEDQNFAVKFVESLGQAMIIDESQFDIFTSFCSTGPLWIYKLAEAMIDTGVYIGFGRDTAKEMVTKNLAGVAKVLELTGENPIDKVYAMTSPGGVTIEAIATLEREGFATAVHNSIVDATKKTKGEL